MGQQTGKRNARLSDARQNPDDDAANWSRKRGANGGEYFTRVSHHGRTGNWDGETCQHNCERRPTKRRGYPNLTRRKKWTALTFNLVHEDLLLRGFGFRNNNPDWRETLQDY